MDAKDEAATERVSIESQYQPPIAKVNSGRDNPDTPPANISTGRATASFTFTR